MGDEEGERSDTVPLSPSQLAPAVPGEGMAAAGGAEDLDEVDPFTHSYPFTLCDKIILGINAFWLFPLRLFLIVIPCIIVGAIVCASSTFCERYDPENPTPRAKWRRVYANFLVPIVDRVFLFGFGFHWIHYKGRPARTKDAPIIVLAPHTSLLDVFVASLYGMPTFVAREDMSRIFIIGPILTRSLRTIYVKREDPDSRMKAAEEIQRRALSGGEWAKVLLFPEGTTHTHKMLLTFKKGAFLPKLPVQPFLIKYSNRGMPTTWGRTGKNMIIGLFLTLCQFHNSLEVEFLDVYRPSEEEKADPQLYAQNVQSLISKSLSIPIGVQSVEDNYFMSYACKLGLPFKTGLILYNKISKEAGIRFHEIRTFLIRFASIDVDKDGWISPQDLATFLGMPNDACLQALFWNKDKTMREKLNFRQYVYSFAVRAKPFLDDKDFLTSVFNFFDQDQDGCVCMADISHVLPVSSLPHVETPQIERRGRGSRRGGRGRLGESSDTLNEEVVGGEDRNMEFDDFKAMLEANPEYLLLFHECQNAGFSSPSTSDPSHASNHTCHAHKWEEPRVLIEVKEVAA